MLRRPALMSPKVYGWRKNIKFQKAAEYAGCYTGCCVCKVQPPLQTYILDIHWLPYFHTWRVSTAKASVPERGIFASRFKSKGADPAGCWRDLSSFSMSIPSKFGKLEWYSNTPNGFPTVSTFTVIVVLNLSPMQPGSRGFTSLGVKTNPVLSWPRGTRLHLKSTSTEQQQSFFSHWRAFPKVFFWRKTDLSRWKKNLLQHVTHESSYAIWKRHDFQENLRPS